MEQSDNPYAPPATSDRPPDSQRNAPSSAIDQPVFHQPVQLLWPLLALSLLVNFAAAASFFGADSLVDRMRSAALNKINIYVNLGTAVLAAPLTALLGDRGAARWLLGGGLLLFAAGELLSLLPWSGLTFVAVVLTVGGIGYTLVQVLVAAYLMRAVTVHGVYVSILLRRLADGLGLHIAMHLSASLREIGPASLVCAAITLSAMTLLIWVRPPAQATLPDEANDPYFQPQQGRSAAAMFLLPVVCGAVISPKGPLPPLHMPSFGLDWFALAFALGLALPLLAYFRRWRPAPIVMAAMVSGSLTWLAQSASLAWKHSAPLAYVGLGSLVSSNVLIPTGITALVRQNVSKERIAAWFTVLSASWMVLGSLYGAMFVALQEHRSTLMVGMSALLVVMTLGWIVLQRHQLAPARDDESVLQGE